MFTINIGNHWNPDVKTDENGKASVQFYNNSTCKHIRISAEGLTKDGVPLVYDELKNNSTK